MELVNLDSFLGNI